MSRSKGPKLELSLDNYLRRILWVLDLRKLRLARRQAFFSSYSKNLDFSLLNFFLLLILLPLPIISSAVVLNTFFTSLLKELTDSASFGSYSLFSSSSLRLSEEDKDSYLKRDNLGTFFFL